MLKYHLGMMKGPDGLPLRHEVDAEASRHALDIARYIRASPAYQALEKRLPSPRLAVYFQYIIRREIFAFIRDALVIRWYRRNGKLIPDSSDKVRAPCFGIFPLLKERWHIDDVTIVLQDDVSYYLNARHLLPELIKAQVKTCRDWAAHRFYAPKKYADIPCKGIGRGGLIACHYAEGIDHFMRSDINWYQDSGIEPERVLLYFNMLDMQSEFKKPIPREIIEKIEGIGMKWVVLKKGVIDGGNSHYWDAPRAPQHLLLRDEIALTLTDKWILIKGNELMRSVHYWRSFYDSFNIQLHYVPEQGGAENIIQAMAFDIYGTGVLVGKQRSELTLLELHDIGHHPNHVLFAWNDRINNYINSYNFSVDQLIVSGYPYIKIKDIQNTAPSYYEKVRVRGAKFVVALFDNGYGSFNPYSPDEMIMFYTVFLRWTIEDTTLGLIIKSKKPQFIERLPQIQALLKKALGTGRCIKISQRGVLAASAARGADMTVGIGISTAVTEAVIEGCRGVHYDPTRSRAHEYYNWGHKELIFDELDELVSALKRYKEEPVNESRLGNWRSYMDRLDPFHYGNGGERMGSYMRCLLQAFDAGMSRDTAIARANEHYSERWGADKVLTIRGACEKS